MRIGIFDPYLDDLGGGEKYMLTIAGCLLPKHNIDVFWDNKQDLDNLAKRFLLDFSAVSLVPNIFSSQTSTVKRLLVTRKYDAIFILSDGSLPLVFSKKLFVHFQQPFPNIKPSFKNNLKKTRVSSFFCNSNFTKSYIDKEFGIDSKIIYPPVEIKTSNIKKEKIILNVGRFRVKDVTTVTEGKIKGIGDYKKQSVMIKVFKEMVGQGLKDWKFILGVSVNKNEEKVFQNFQNSAKGYPIEFLVNKNNDELWLAYSKAKIYWHASGFGEDLENHPEFAEHFGISTVEAMGAGAVPVVINAGGQKEIVKEGANGLLWDSLQELKTKTHELITNQVLFAKLAKEASACAHKFSKDNFCREINKLILE